MKMPTSVDLGLDSLAAVELADELRSQFGKEISVEDLLMNNFNSLCRQSVYSQKKTTIPTKSKIFSPPPDMSDSLRPTEKYPSAPSANSIEQGSRSRQQILQMIADNCGISVTTIEDKATPRDLGVDSLSVIELKTDIKDAFSLEISDSE